MQGNDGLIGTEKQRLKEVKKLNKTTDTCITKVQWLAAPLCLLPVSVVGELDMALDLSLFCGKTEICQ